MIVARPFPLLALLACCLASGLVSPTEAKPGVIKDLFQKVTNSNNKTEDLVKQSAPICGSGIFSTANEGALSPEIIFITSRPSSSSNYGSNSERRRHDQVNEVAKEFRFHVENVTLEELERHGFNRRAPVSFVMHGFTSGYPLQAWISAIVEAYTIDRDTRNRRQANYQREPASFGSQQGQRQNQQQVNHNLFIVNWHYAARGINYPRAVANIPIVASYVTRFINERLLEGAGVEPQRIQLIGHSLGAHLAGFIGKNTRSKLARIYGLDPAGPCFGTLTGPLYPSSKRLAPTDAAEVITVHTNSALLGIDKPLGRYSVFVEGGAKQPGCKGGGVLKSISALTLDGSDLDDISCSHGRAPNLLTYRLDQAGSQDDCQMVAYQCKDWDSFTRGHCGVCSSYEADDSSRRANSNDPRRPVECQRIGLDWQYPSESSSGGRRPSRYEQEGRRPPQTTSWSERQRREARNSSMSSEAEVSEQRGNRDEEDDRVKPISMYLRTGDTQPYCAFHYQVILELNEPFPRNKKPPISLVMQDSEGGGSSRRSEKEQNSLTNDNFGDKFDDTTYTHLLTSAKKLRQVDHATLLFRDGLPDGHRILKSLQVNYMSHIDPSVRQRLSRRLCLVKKDVGGRGDEQAGSNRFYFEPCDHSSSSSGGHQHENHQHDHGYSSHDHNQHHSHQSGRESQQNGYSQSGYSSQAQSGQNYDRDNQQSNYNQGGYSPQGQSNYDRNNQSYNQQNSSQADRNNYNSNRNNNNRNNNNNNNSQRYRNSTTSW